MVIVPWGYLTRSTHFSFPELRRLGVIKGGLVAEQDGVETNDVLKSNRC